MTSSPQRDELPSSISLPLSDLLDLMTANNLEHERSGRIRFWMNEIQDDDFKPDVYPIVLDDVATALSFNAGLPIAFVQEYLVAMFCVGREVARLHELQAVTAVAEAKPRCIGQIQESQEGGRTRYKVMHNSSVLDANGNGCPKCGEAGRRSRFAVRVRSTDADDLDDFPVENRSKVAYEIHIANQESYETAVREMEHQRRRVNYLGMDIKRALGACIDRRGNHPHWSLAY